MKAATRNVQNNKCDDASRQAAPVKNPELMVVVMVEASGGEDDEIVDVAVVLLKPATQWEEPVHLP